MKDHFWEFALMCKICSKGTGKTTRNPKKQTPGFITKSDGYQRERVKGEYGRNGSWVRGLWGQDATLE